MFIENGEFGLRISMGIEQVEPFLQFFSKGSFEEFLDSVNGNRSIGVDGFEGRNGGANFGEEGAHVIGLVRVAGMADVNAVLKVGVGLNVDAPQVGAGSQHIRHAVNRCCDRKSGHGDRVEHGIASLG